MSRVTKATICRALLAVVVSAASACQESESDGSVLVADSSKVEIVFSSRPTYDAGAWSTSARPLLEIRGGTSGGDHPLYQVTGLSFVPGRGLVVANRGDGTLRLYDESGQLVWSAGGLGEGPAEFTDLRGVARRANELWAFQSLPRPIKVFDVDGALIDVVGTHGTSGPRLRGFLPDGSLIVLGRGEGVRAGRVWTEYAPILRHGDLSSDTVAVLPHREVVDLGRLGAEAQALGPFLQVAVGGRWIYAGYPTEWDVQVLAEDGQLARRIRRSWEPSPVTDQHVVAYRAALVESGAAMGDASGLYRDLAEAMVFPRHHPAFDRILVADSGELWVQRPQTEPPWSEGLDYNPVPYHEAAWDIFAADGGWLATVTLPARFRLMSVSVDALVGIAKDELDVERVQVWGLQRKP